MDKIELLSYSLERCHEFYKNYTADPMMTHEPFVYHKDHIDKYYKNKVMDPNRRYFAIVYQSKTIGEIQIKHIDPVDKSGTLSIIIGEDKHKNMGFGSEAIKLILKYAKDQLKFKKIYADAIHRNKRSQHVLEKIAFEYLKEDDVLKYYQHIL